MEINIPNPDEFLPLGYDPKDKRLDPSKIQKHYRYFLDTELENSPFMDKFTFDEYSITRGSRIKSDSVFMEMLGFEESEKIVGKFKGWIDIISENDKKKIEGSKAGILARNYLENRQITGAEVKNKKKVEIDKEFIDKTQIIVRVYVLTGSSLPQMDDDSLSDPFIEITLGNEKKNVNNNLICIN